MPRLLAGFVVGRLPVGFLTVALLLSFAAATGSVAIGAGVVAGYTLLLALAAPALGRAIDRLGARTVLRRAAAAHVVLLLLAAVVLAGPQPHLAVAPAVLAGACVPPLPAALRSRWPSLIGAEPARLTTALSAETVLVEGCYLAGPLLAAGAAATGHPSLGLLIAATCVAVGTAAFTAAPVCAVRSGARAKRNWGGPLHSPGVRRVLVAAGSSGVVIGLLVTAVTAEAARRGQPALAGVALAVAGGVSLAGAIAWGSLSQGRRHAGAVATLAVLLVLAGAPLLAAPGWTGALAALLLAHVPVPALSASLAGWAGVVAPAGQSAETFTWLTSAGLVGAAAGSTLAGIAPLLVVGIAAVACATVCGLTAARSTPPPRLLPDER